MPEGSNLRRIGARNPVVSRLAIAKVTDLIRGLCRVNARQLFEPERSESLRLAKAVTSLLLRTIVSASEF